MWWFYMSYIYVEEKYQVSIDAFEEFNHYLIVIKLLKRIVNHFKDLNWFKDLAELRQCNWVSQW